MRYANPPPKPVAKKQKTRGHYIKKAAKYVGGALVGAALTAAAVRDYRNEKEKRKQGEARWSQHEKIQRDKKYAWDRQYRFDKQKDQKRKDEIKERYKKGKEEIDQRMNFPSTYLDSYAAQREREIKEKIKQIKRK